VSHQIAFEHQYDGLICPGGQYILDGMPPILEESRQMTEHRLEREHLIVRRWPIPPHLFGIVLGSMYGLHPQEGGHIAKQLMQDFHRYLQGRNIRWGHFGQVDEAVHRGQSGGIRNDGVVGGLGGACKTNMQKVSQ
jgi:hypothetical protein